jgi:hypothetical protein
MDNVKYAPKEWFTLFGGFSPKGWVTAIFPTEEAAQNAMADLKVGGYREDDIVFPNREELIGVIEKSFEEKGSGSIGAESSAAKDNLRLLKEGNFSILVHAKSEDETDRVLTVLNRHNAIKAQKYNRFTIESLITK